MAAQLDVDVRMGFENNIYNPTGGFASSNAEQVKRLADQLEEEVNLSAMPASNFRDVSKLFTVSVRSTYGNWF